MDFKSWLSIKSFNGASSIYNELWDFLFAIYCGVYFIYSILRDLRSTIFLYTKTQILNTKFIEFVKITGIFPTLMP
jgi:hypothetical protein